MTSPKSELSLEFSNLCRSSGLIAVFAFGSRGDEIQQRLSGIDPEIENPASDLDLGVLADRDVDFDVMRIVDFSCAVEDLFGVPRADIVDLRKAPPYLALDAIRGHRIFCADDFEASVFELFVLRRAGDLAYHERERRRMLLTPRSERRIGSP
jgi:hypothetical protein